jgi:hypothetical protein
MHILSLLRRALPQTESILMDEPTLERYRTMTVVEPKPFAGPIGYLTESELAVLNRLRRDDSRLEQERIEMSYAQTVISQRLQEHRPFT